MRIGIGHVNRGGVRIPALFFLISAAVAAAVFGVRFFTGGGSVTEAPPAGESAGTEAPAADPRGAGVVAGNIRQTASEDGETLWRLKAMTARYFDEARRAVAEDIHIRFYPEDENIVGLSAREGVIRTDTNDVSVTGDVEVTSRGYRLTTRFLRFDHKRRALATDEPVTITGPAGRLEADAAVFELETNRAVFRGNVRGTFAASTFTKPLRNPEKPRPAAPKKEER